MCKCGCNTCEVKIKGPLLTENKQSIKPLLSEGLNYHINKKIPLFETVYRIGSEKHLSLIREVRKLYSRGIIDLCEEDKDIIKTHLGEFATYQGQVIPLDLPMLDEGIEESKKDNKPIGKPTRDSSGGKAYKVYVRDPKTKNIKTVRFGSGGLRAKIRDKDARQAFAKRHRCSEKKDKTKASYWSCRLPMYASALGLGSNMNTFW